MESVKVRAATTAAWQWSVEKISHPSRARARKFRQQECRGMVDVFFVCVCCDVNEAKCAGMCTAGSNILIYTIIYYMCAGIVCVCVNRASEL